MFKREVKRVKNKVGKYLDPFGIIALILLFILPALAVINLSPESNRNLSMNKNVLGETDGKKLGFVMVGGVHDYFKEENLDFTSDNVVKYSTTIIKHNAGTYSKPILVLENSNGSDQTITITGTLANPSDSEISVIYKDKYYRVISQSGEPFTVSLNIPENSKEILYVSMNTVEDISFNNSLELSFVQN